MLPEIPDLIALLSHRAAHTPEQAAFSLDGETTTFRALWASTGAFAGALLQAGLQPQDRVLIALPSGAPFFSVFYGVQRAGGIPVPLFPDSGPERITDLAAQCMARFLVSDADISPPGSLVHIAPDTSGPQPAGPAPVHPDSIAYIQFTSGSTGEPKGVPITHANLLTNMRQMIAGMEITAEDVFVSWLPVYHDMGLILMTMVPFYLGARLELLPTSFVNLRRWLARIEEVGGTFTASPDFGYRLALRYASPAAAYDLHTLRVALNAAEPARPGTIQAFEQAFGLENVMTVGYGLAEATVGVSMTPPGKPVRVNADGFTSAGMPFPGVEIRIDDQNGEILVRSPANVRGYYRDPAATERLFTEDGFLRTGDTGALEQGELFVTGRLKEMLKHAGRTIAPREVEAALDGHEGLRAAAAVSLDLGGLAGEQVVVAAEVAHPARLDADGLHALAVDLVARIHARMGIRPARVYLVRPRAIPVTPNGKVQRMLLRDQLRDGRLQRSGEILYPDY